MTPVIVPGRVTSTSVKVWSTSLCTNTGTDPDIVPSSEKSVRPSWFTSPTDSPLAGAFDIGAVADAKPPSVCWVRSHTSIGLVFGLVNRRSSRPSPFMSATARSITGIGLMKSDADEGMSPPPPGSRNTSIPGLGSPSPSTPFTSATARSPNPSWFRSPTTSR